MARRTTPQSSFIVTSRLQRLMVNLMLLGLLCLAGYLLVKFIGMAWQEHQINRAIERQESQNAQQIERNRRLQAAAEWAESDVAAERAARERLGMAREGEVVLLPTVVLPPPPTAAPPAPVPATSLNLAPPRRETNAGRWFRALFPGPDALP